METKNAKVRRLVAAGQYKQALQICKDWDYESRMDRETLRLGYECLLYPSFYSQLGHDPELEYQRAVRVLIRVYT